VFKYRLLPASEDNLKYDRRASLILKGLFQFLPVVWRSNKDWLAKLKARDYSFCQFAAHAPMFNYRRWLKLNAYSALHVDPEVRDKAVTQASGAYRYAKQFNCPPSACRYQLKGARALIGKGIQICRRRYCPHCHFRRVVKLATRAVRSAIRIRRFYDNLNVFVYEAKIDHSVAAKEVPKLAAKVASVAESSPFFLGLTWYFLPLTDRENGGTYWQLRFFVLGGGAFDLDRCKIGPELDVQMLRARPANNVSLCKQISLAMSWGRNAMWYDYETSVMWNQMSYPRVRSIAHYGVMTGKKDHKVYAKFKKNIPKFRKKLFPHSLLTTGTSTSSTV
jgi:hypothetical protein